MRARRQRTRQRTRRRRARQKVRARETAVILPCWWPRLVERRCELLPGAALAASRAPRPNWGRVYRSAEGECLALGFTFSEAAAFGRLAAENFFQGGPTGYRAVILFASAIARGRRGNAGAPTA